MGDRGAKPPQAPDILTFLRPQNDFEKDDEMDAVIAGKTESSVKLSDLRYNESLNDAVIGCPNMLKA